MNIEILLAALSTSAAVALAYPSLAEACGGTFCDTGPASMPVDQTGENILFVMSETTVEAHIQIQYDPTTTAEKFAWVVPVTQIPSFEVGSDRLFQNLLSSTVPAYGFTSSFEDCGGGTGAGGSSGGGFETGTSGGGSGGTTGGGGPEVVFEDTVGAFDIVVLQGGTAQEVMDWLAANDYDQDPAAEPILGEYLAEGYLFAAFRLTNGADVAEIHPIALIFDSSDEACVPIRLTRIAAQEDMEVRSFFLADNRVVPQNYRHVLVNPLKLDWNNFAANYKDVITLAVDADQANGHAFVTEYAGGSGIVNQGGIYSAQWNAVPFEAVDPTGVIDLLEGQGLASCFDDGGSSGGLGTICQYNHALIRGLLAQWLPVPVGVDEGEFYGCLVCFEPQIDQMAWDGPAFAQALQERVIDPGQRAVDLLNAFPALTRMYTTISPGEMTEDPFFYENPDLPNVNLTSEVASRFVQCNGSAIWTLPDGRTVYAPNANSWPDFQGEMPWEEDIEEIAPAGAPVALVDNTVFIDTLLEQHNCQYNYPSPEACDGVGGTGAADTTGGDNGTGGTASGGTVSGGTVSGGTASGGTDSAGQGDDSGGGCGCSSRPPTPAWWLGLLGLGLLGVRRRRG